MHLASRCRKDAGVRWLTCDINATLIRGRKRCRSWIWIYATWNWGALANRSFVRHLPLTELIHDSFFEDKSPKTIQRRDPSRLKFGSREAGKRLNPAYRHFDALQFQHSLSALFLRSWILRNRCTPGYLIHM